MVYLAVVAGVIGLGTVSCREMSILEGNMRRFNRTIASDATGVQPEDIPLSHFHALLFAGSFDAVALRQVCETGGKIRHSRCSKL